MPDSQSPSRRTLVIAGVTALVLGGAAFWLFGTGNTEDGRDRGWRDYAVSDGSPTYHGTPQLFSRPAVVRADDVYARIPQYQTIRSEGLSDSVPRYHFLMKEASQQFSRAVRLMAGDMGHDYVGEVGSIEVRRDGAAPPPDRTAEVIAKLQ